MMTSRPSDPKPAETTRSDANELPRRGAKLAYVAPRLIRYGDVKAITRSIGGTGALDGGMGKKTNTRA